MSGSQQPTLEIADIFRQFSHLLGPMPPQAWKVVQAIKNCRTAILGGHQLRCNNCDLEKNAYNSCRNRHCPKCQTMVKEKWLNDRKADLLPCNYFHLVFTVPHKLNPIILSNKKIMLNGKMPAMRAKIKRVIVFRFLHGKGLQ